MSRIGIENEVQRRYGCRFHRLDLDVFRDITEFGIGFEIDDELSMGLCDAWYRVDVMRFKNTSEQLSPLLDKDSVMVFGNVSFHSTLEVNGV